MIGALRVNKLTTLLKKMLLCKTQFIYFVYVVSFNFSLRKSEEVYPLVQPKEKVI